MDKRVHRPKEGGPEAPIIFVPFFDAFGGVERLALALGGFLCHEGLPSRLVCFHDTIGMATYADWPVRVEQLKPRRNVIAEVRNLTNILREATAASAPLPMIFDLKGAFYAGWRGRRGGYTLHLTDPPSLLPTDISKHAPSAKKAGKWMTGREGETRPARGLARMLRSEAVHRANARGVRKARAVIVMTDRIAAEVRDLYGVTAHVIRPGVEVPREIAKPSRGNAPLQLLSICRLESSKRIDQLLRALAELNSGTEPNWSLTVVGDGSQREKLRELVGHLGLAAKVKFAGRIPDEVVKHCYADADLFLMPAAQGYGLPALEALAMGVPVVVSCESGVSEILGNTPWANLTDGSMSGLIGAIRGMLIRIRARAFDNEAAFAVPAQKNWARQICELNGWL